MQEAVLRRNIQALYHFTRLENVDSIMRSGIVPRNQLDQQNIEYQFNDTVRLDCQEGASSFSIEHPNYKMFWRLRMENSEQSWVVIGVKRNILWEKDCAFCHENAASANVTRIPITERRGAVAFERMFAPVNGKPDRAALRLADKYPTNPQAEVLVFDIVEPSYILCIACANTELKDELKQRYPEFHVVKHSPYFSYRHDYEAWK